MNNFFGDRRSDQVIPKRNRAAHWDFGASSGMQGISALADYPC